MSIDAAAHILNVNDDEASRYAVTRTLQAAGFSVTEASCGQEALDLAQASLPDLVVLDVKLPDIDGFEVCRRLKTSSESSEIPILHLTANALATEHKVRSIQHGADAYLAFPLEPPYLVATIRSLLRLREAEADRQRALAGERAKSESLQRALDELRIERELRDQFIATLTHDLRSPLTAIKMCGQLILRRPESVENTARQSSKVIAAADRMNALIQNLLDASLIRAGQRLPIAPTDLALDRAARDVVDELVTVHGDRFRVDLGADLQGRWDPSGIRRILENLLQNAVKYGDPLEPITLSIADTSAGVRILVHNYGNIIPEETRSRLFDAFRRGGAEGELREKPGWGLGLTLVRGMAEAHGGSVRVESSAELRGTRFIVELPRVAQGIEESRLVPDPAVFG